MQSYLSERKQRVVLEGASSDWLPVTSGVPQGSILGPLLFLVYVNDVPSCIINNSNIALFADDSKLYRAMGKNYDHNLLQADLDCLHTWSLSSGLDFNSRKCKVLHISKKKSTRETNRNYSLGDQPIERVSSFVDLGITISHNLSWADHIEKIVVKANRTLGLMKRIFRDLQDIQTRKIIYCALVRPKLEYGSSLWSPYTKKYVKLIENVQRRATKFILNYPEDMKYIDRLIKLNLLPLEYRRQISDLTFFFKSRNGLVTTDINKFLTVFEPGYRTRNYDINNYNLIIKHKQDYYRKSYFIRTAELWNTLPSQVKQCESIRTFKTVIYNFYSSKGRFPLRKISIGSDQTGLFFILYYPHRWMKKVENTTTLYRKIIGSNWNRKLIPKAHARFQFCSDPVRSHAYFPEWKPALSVWTIVLLSGPVIPCN